MRILFKSLIALPLIASATPAFAQEIIVTAQRRPAGNYDGGYSGGIVAASRPIINLKRTADYVVQSVRITGDTRDAAKRMEELNATLRNAIGAAAKAGVELATGDYVLEPLTLNSMRNLNFAGDGRPDTSQTTFLVKVKLVPGMDIPAAKLQIAKFIGSVSKVGRTSFMTWGEPTLSVVNPDQYRGQIIDLIAADAREAAAKFGPGYGVDVTGLDRPVEWARGGPVEVFLYLPSAYVIRKD
ncbi:TonB-dependent receptor [Sphingomonas canadensis]|uniref:TonB-dependent receptor n=1 Tax=Sphingomonas canadensis TaxID=1219257 RepID=A0ABW3H6T6_9SPHN|nr:TonB-dependent receptor [Sphingomonas canadensis]MCW3836773.1 TonB-dependent receptor [Sphingomonas canadensis]